jgi:hypothetical protein
LVKTINTSGISIKDVKDQLIDNGLNLDGDITDYVNSDWYEHRGTGDLSHTLYVHQVPEFISFHGQNPDLWGHSVVLLGPTAIGKSEGVRQGLNLAAQYMGRELDLKELHVSQMGPVDALGVPREANGRTYWAPPEIWPLVKSMPDHQVKAKAFMDHYKATGKINYELLPEKWYVHFHDEVTNPSSPQVPHQLFPSWCGDGDGKMIGGHKLVSDFMVVLAGNRLEDGTNSINLASSAVTRLCMIEVVPHYGGWLQNYAFKPKMVAGQEMCKIHPLVISYLGKFNRQFAPQDMSERSAMDPFPTPRNWRFVSDELYANDQNAMPEFMLKAAIAGRIGDASAQQFFTFVSHYKELPDVDKLMKGIPVNNFPKKDRVDLLLILGTHMVMKLNKENAVVFMDYMLDDTKFPTEIATATMKQLRTANKLSPLVREWARESFSKWVQNNKAFVF